MVTEKFLTDSNSVWWWTRLNSSPRVVVYSGSVEFFSKLRELVPGDSRAVLLVMNDSGSPGGAIEGPFASLISVIEDSIGFEFIISSPEGEWGIFDTHHNELLILGSLNYLALALRPHARSRVKTKACRAVPLSSRE
jgi:hypothetical protein